MPVATTMGCDYVTEIYPTINMPVAMAMGCTYIVYIHKCISRKLLSSSSSSLVVTVGTAFLLMANARGCTVVVVMVYPVQKLAHESPLLTYAGFHVNVTFADAEIATHFLSHSC